MAKTKNLRLRKTFWWGDDGKVFCSLAFRVFWWVDPTFLQRVRTWRARARRWWRRPGSCRWSSAPPPHPLAAADSRSQHLKTIVSGNVQWEYRKEMLIVKRNENRVWSSSFLDVSLAIFRLYFKASTGYGLTTRQILTWHLNVYSIWAMSYQMTLLCRLIVTLITSILDLHV